jgi:hypothetical protein
MVLNVFIDIHILNKLTKNDVIALKHFECHFSCFCSVAFITGLGIYFVDHSCSTLFNFPLYLVLDVLLSHTYNLFMSGFEKNNKFSRQQTMSL